MAATTIHEVMLGIETRLATISGLRVSEILPDQVNPPQALVGPPDIPEYRTTFRRGLFTVNPTVTILVSAAYDRTGQVNLTKYMDVSGPQSIPAAIEGDRTLGGKVAECYVASFQRLGMEDVNKIGYYGGVFTLFCRAKGN